jgi:hypothetical protein
MGLDGITRNPITLMGKSMGHGNLDPSDGIRMMGRECHSASFRRMTDPSPINWMTFSLPSRGSHPPPVSGLAFSVGCVSAYIVGCTKYCKGRKRVLYATEDKNSFWTTR